jgi:hypothetical protein
LPHLLAIFDNVPRPLDADPGLLPDGGQRELLRAAEAIALAGGDPITIGPFEFRFPPRWFR